MHGINCPSWNWGNNATSCYHCTHDGALAIWLSILWACFKSVIQYHWYLLHFLIIEYWICIIFITLHIKTVNTVYDKISFKMLNILDLAIIILKKIYRTLHYNFDSLSSFPNPNEEIMAFWAIQTYDTKSDIRLWFDFKLSFLLS